MKIQSKQLTNNVTLLYGTATNDSCAGACPYLAVHEVQSGSLISDDGGAQTTAHSTHHVFPSVGT